MDSFELNRYTPPTDKVKAFLEEGHKKTDQNVIFYLLGYLIGGCVLALAVGDVIWYIAAGFGTVIFIMHFVYYLIPNKITRRYLLGFTLSLYTILFFYASSGAIYVQLFLPVSLVIIALYGNWRFILPYLITMAIYYAASIFRISNGDDWKTYFINDPIVDNTDNFIVICVSCSVLTLFLMIHLCEYIKHLKRKEAKVYLFLQDQLNVEHNVSLVNNIALGNLDGKYEIKENDKIGQALFQMREKLKKAAEKDQKQRWISEGIGHMGDILLASSDVSEICHNVLREIIRYIGLEHGGIFIVNQADIENPYLELRSFFAFDQTEFIEKKIGFNEGLVGEVATRKTSMLLKDIPENFENIKSGLGSALPKSIFITPLMVKDEVLGVLELASLREFETHELELVEKVCSNIALSILSANAATQTARLLKESQVYNEQMRAQEEEMRSSMEALRQTQDELSKQVEARASMQSELSARMKVVDRMAMVAEIDLDGNLIYINDQFKKVTGYKSNECIGKKYTILRHPETEERIFKEIWVIINRNEIYVGAFKSITKNGDVVWFECAIAAVLDHENKATKFLCIGFDITTLKQKEQDIQNLLNQVKARNEILNEKEESMHRNLQALEIAEQELSDQIQMSIRNQEFYDLVLTFVKGIIYRCTLDDKWNIEFLSTGTYELTGYDHTDFVNNKVRSFYSIIHPDDIQLIEESVTRNQTLFEESSSSVVQGFKIRYRIIRADGEVRWVEDRGKKFYDHYLKKEILTGFIYDITETVMQDL